MGIVQYEGTGRIPGSRLYLVGGQDRWLVRDATDAIIASAVGPDAQPSAVTWLDGAQVGVSAIMDAVEGGSLFDPTRVVVVDRVRDLLGELDIEALARRIPKECTLILLATNIDRRLTFVKRAVKHGAVLDCSVPRGGRLISYLRGRADGLGVRVERGALEVLVEYVGDDLGALCGEIEKLAVYAADAKTVRAKDVRALTAINAAENAFRLADAAAEGDTRRAFEVLESLLRTGEPHQRILGLIGWQFRRLRAARRLMDARVPEREIAERLRLRGPSAAHVLDAVRRMSPESLQRTDRLIIEADLASKTGAMPERLVIEKLVVELCNAASC